MEKEEGEKRFLIPLAEKMVDDWLDA